jgi:lysozyme
MTFRVAEAERIALFAAALALVVLIVARPAIMPPAAPGPDAPEMRQATPGEAQPQSRAGPEPPPATDAAQRPPPQPADAANAPPTATRAQHGVDVSHYQSRVDWAALTGGGVGFVYAKATEGATYVDPSFARHRSGASGAKLPFGAYHFYRPDDDPVAQAEHFLKTASPGRGDLAPALDLEIAPASGDGDAYRAGVRAWIEHVAKATGCAPIVYASPAFWSAHLGDAAADQPFWLADYAARPHPPEGAPGWTLWQRSQKGRVHGIGGVVDLDLTAAGGVAALTCDSAG